MHAQALFQRWDVLEARLPGIASGHQLMAVAAALSLLMEKLERCGMCAPMRDVQMRLAWGTRFLLLVLWPCMRAPATCMTQMGVRGNTICTTDKWHIAPCMRVMRRIKARLDHALRPQ